jgi:hypothetical protein
MAIILTENKVNLFVSSVLFVFWYHSADFLHTPRIITYISEHAVSLVTTKYMQDWTYVQWAITMYYTQVSSTVIPKDMRVNLDFLLKSFPVDLL